MKHTPGTWQVHETCHQMNFEDTTVCEIKYLGQDKSFFVGSSATNHGDALATAKLIAAAPDLLAALQKLAKFHRYWRDNDLWSDEDEETQLEAEAAIKKATE